jgi:hypothetical protein
MYVVLVSPLSHVVVGPDEDPALGVEFVEMVQQSVAREVGTDVAWDDTAELQEVLEADELDPFCWHGLRAAALRLEQEGDLEGFDPGEEPWDHPLFEEAEGWGGSKQFPQVVHGEADLVAYAPVELTDCFRLTPTADPDEEGEGDEDEERDGDVALGSLPALRRELKLLGKALGLPETPVISESLVPEDSDDPLVEARFACAVLAVRAAEATERGLPLIVAWDDTPDDDEGGEGGEGGDGGEAGG